MTTCQARQQRVEDGPLESCGNRAAGLYRAMCVHEHIRERWLCAACRDGHSQRGTLCLACYTADGHECPMGPVTEADRPPA